MTRRLRMTCWSVATVAAAMGLVVHVLPWSSAIAPIAPSVQEPGRSASPQLADETIAEAIAVANVFALSRTPPLQRYAPPEFGGDSANGMMGEGSDEVPIPDAPMMMHDVPRLFGTVVGLGGTKALLQLDPSASGPRLYGVGERDGGYRIVSIAPRAVVLSGSDGRVTLRLDSQEERP